MKKIAILIAVAMVFSAGFAFATDCGDQTSACDTIADTNSPDISIELSPNVELGYKGSANAYTVLTWNSSGNRAYTATSTDSGLYVSAAEVSSSPTISGSAGATLVGNTAWAQVGQ